LARVLCQALAWQCLQPVAEGDLQRRAKEWHQGGGKQIELAVEQRDGPGLALTAIGLAEAVERSAYRWVAARPVARQQGIQRGQPGIAAHQRVEAQRRHAMLDAARLALR